MNSFLERVPSARLKDSTVSDIIDLPQSPVAGSSASTQHLDTNYNVQGSTRKSKRKSRGGGPGRGGKGIKRGPRIPLEPPPEFKALHSEATMAFIAHDYDKAEHLTLQALQINPEMYSAHSLLSEIHAVRGDTDKALTAAWNAAHLRPRDTQIWSSVARRILERDEEHQESTLRDALYCYTRIISVDTTDLEARFQRAALNRELGLHRKAAAEYEQLLKLLPHDTAVLRLLAEVCIELNEPAKALRQYHFTISFLQDNDPHDPKDFGWSDVNIIAELCIFGQQYSDGLQQLKFLSRWLLGRIEEDCWDDFHIDDREFDAENGPRRLEVAGFLPDIYNLSSYGEGLPLELRVKLGIFRLKTDPVNTEEAKVSRSDESGA